MTKEQALLLLQQLAEIRTRLYGSDNAYTPEMAAMLVELTAPATEPAEGEV